MTYQEYISWIKYRNRWGTLHFGMRIDRAIARAAAFFGNFLSRKRSLKSDDFSPHDQKQDRVGSVDEVFSLLSSMAKKD